MKKMVAMAALLVVLAGLAPAPAQAGGATSAALGLASFAVFNQLLFGFGLFTPAFWTAPPFYGVRYYGGGYYYGGYAPVVYASPPVVSYPPPAYYPQPTQTTYAPPARPVQNQVVYPHGRYVLHGDGVTSAYQWVWIANQPAAVSGVQGSASPPPAR